MKISLLGVKEVYTSFGKKPLSPKVRQLQACVLDKRHVIMHGEQTFYGDSTLQYTK